MATKTTTKKTATKATATQATPKKQAASKQATGKREQPAPRKGDIYKTTSGQLIEVTNGRLKDEGENGASFEGRTIEFNTQTGNANRAKTTDRFYLDELSRKLSKKDYDEWVAVGRREAEALADASDAPDGKTPPKKTTAPKTNGKTPATKTNAKTTDTADKKLSALDAAAKVLGEAKKPLNAKTMIERMAAQKYWTSPGGKTPHATLYAAILREINTKGKDARFIKADRGLFTLTK